jgi:hypothetical protein
MTEAEWLTCKDPELMLEHIRGHEPPGNRKLGMFAVACCRRIRETLFDSTVTPQLLEAIERVMEGEDPEMNSVRMAHRNASTMKWRNTADIVFEAEGAVHALGPPLRLGEVLRYTCEVAAFEALCDAAVQSSKARSYRWWKRGPNLTEDDIQAARAEGFGAERGVHCRLIHDICGNPFRPVTLNPAWLTSTVLALAQQMYDSRDFSAMPILADALQDAGCDDEEVLNHCRGLGPHVRGCWVVDRLLSKG